MKVRCTRPFNHHQLGDVFELPDAEARVFIAQTLVVPDAQAATEGETAALEEASEKAVLPTPKKKKGKNR